VSIATRVVRLSPGRDLLVALGAVCAIEAVVVLAYVATSPSTTAPRYLLYPFLWLNVAGLAIVTTEAPAASTRRKALAAAVGVGYLLGLSVVDGTIAFASASGIDVFWSLPPGWGPMVVADLGPLRIAPIPYRTLGYAAIAYLLYVAILDASSRMAGGLVGLLSCVSCTFPVIAAAVSGIAGGTGLAAAAALSYDWAYDLSTVVFLVTIGALVWGTTRVRTAFA
jgi:hypothetical protein